MNRLRITFGLLLCSLSCVCFAQKEEQKCTISDCITTFSEEHVNKNSTGWAFWFIPADGIADTLSVKMSYVDKGIKTHEPHSHFEDELFYMVEGTSIVRLNEEEHVLKPGDAFYAPGNSSHNIRRTDDHQAIKYVMFKREIRGKLSEPFLPGIKNYSMKDYLIPFKESALTKNGNDKTMWYLTKEMSAGGLNARLHILSGSALHEADGYSGQEVYFILDGKANVSVNCESRTIEPLSSCYCPAGSKHSIRNVVKNVLKFIVVRTK